MQDAKPLVTNDKSSYEIKTNPRNPTRHKVVEGAAAEEDDEENKEKEEEEK